MNIFYQADIKEEDQFIYLPENESKHCCKVLRLKKGEQIIVMNGKGTFYQCDIVESNSKKCLVEIKNKEFESETSSKIHIALCLLKNQDRIEWFVEKATEIGVTEISFLTSTNCERKKINYERIQKVVLSACKQTQRKYLPIIHEVCNLEEFVTKYPEGAIAHCYPGNKLHLKNNFNKYSYPILIGPEGDFSKEEIHWITEKKYTPITLGKNRLRSETAALYCCFLAKFLIES